MLINMKPRVYSGLVSSIGDSDKVSNAYPQSFNTLPQIAYTEEDNVGREFALDLEEGVTYIRYKIDIWSNSSTTDIVMAIEEQMKELGFTRTNCSDIEEPNGLLHKVLRYQIYL